MSPPADPLDGPPPLYTERKTGARKPVEWAGFAYLVERAIRDARDKRLFAHEFGHPSDFSFGQDTPRAFFIYRMGGDWPVDVLYGSINHLKYRGHSVEAGDEDVYDLIELLHAIASLPADTQGESQGTTYDQAAGQAMFRDAINEPLARHEPPMELLPSGQVVERLADEMRRLIETPVPPNTEAQEVTQRIDDAVAHYRRRGATAGDRRAAVRELADVLEFLRDEVKEVLLPEDERALFRLANEFAIRHNKRETRRDFDEPAWLAWAFYVYLATIRVVLELRKSQEG